MTDNKAEAVNIKPPQGVRGTKKPPRAITADYLHNAGLYYLQRFAASSGHFRRVMMRKVERSCRYHTDQDKDSCAAMVDALIEKFQRAGLLDDGAYARGAVTSLRSRGLSSRAIQSRLAAKSLQATAIEAALARDAQDRGETDPDLIAALRLARKKRIGPFGPGAAQDKAMAAMARAGFTYETARKALGMGLADADDVLGL